MSDHDREVNTRTRANVAVWLISADGYEARFVGQYLWRYGRYGHFEVDGGRHERKRFTAFARRLCPDHSFVVAAIERVADQLLPMACGTDGTVVDAFNVDIEVNGHETKFRVDMALTVGGVS